MGWRERGEKGSRPGGWCSGGGGGGWAKAETKGMDSAAGSGVEPGLGCNPGAGDGIGKGDRAGDDSVPRDGMTADGG